MPNLFPSRSPGTIPDSDNYLAQNALVATSHLRRKYGAYAPTADQVKKAMRKVVTLGGDPFSYPQGEWWEGFKSAPHIHPFFQQQDIHTVLDANVGVFNTNGMPAGYGDPVGWWYNAARPQHTFINKPADTVLSLTPQVDIGSGQGFKITMRCWLNSPEFYILSRNGSSGQRLMFLNNLFYAGPSIPCTPPSTGKEIVLEVIREDGVLSVLEDGVLLGSGAHTSSISELNRIWSSQGFTTSAGNLQGMVFSFRMELEGSGVVVDLTPDNIRPGTGDFADGAGKTISQVLGAGVTSREPLHPGFAVSGSEPPVYFPWKGRNYAHFPNLPHAARGIYTPHSPDMVPDDFAIEVYVDPGVWGSTSGRRPLFTKWIGQVNGRRFWFEFEGDGNRRVRLLTYQAGGIHTVNQPGSISLTDGAPGYLRVDRRALDGRIRFFQSPDGVEWQQLGADQFGLPGPIDTASAARFTIGNLDGASNSAFSGRIHHVKYWKGAFDSADRDLLAEFVADDMEHTDPSYTDSKGNMWTIESDVVTDPIFLVGTSCIRTQISGNSRMLVNLGQTLPTFHLMASFRPLASSGDWGRVVELHSGPMTPAFTDNTGVQAILRSNTGGGTVYTVFPNGELRPSQRPFLSRHFYELRYDPVGGEWRADSEMSESASAAIDTTQLAPAYLSLGAAGDTTRRACVIFEAVVLQGSGATEAQRKESQYWTLKQTNRLKGHPRDMFFLETSSGYRLAYGSDYYYYSRWHPASIDYFARLTAEGDSDYLPFRPAIDRLMRELVNINYYDALENGFLYLWAGTGWQGRSVTVHPGSPAPTFHNFVAGDHNILTGIKGRPGDGTYVDSNHSNSANGQNDQAMGVWAEFDGFSGTQALIGAGNAENGATTLHVSPAETLFGRNRSSTPDNIGGAVSGFIGVSRDNSASFSALLGGVLSSKTRTSQIPYANNIGVFCRLTTQPNFIFGGSIPIAFTGPAVDLEALKSIFSNYMGSLGS